MANGLVCSIAEITLFMISKIEVFLITISKLN